MLLNACTVHDCARTGLLATGDLDQQPADVCVVGCALVGNRADGAVFLDGAVARFERCTVERNKGFGLRLKVRGKPFPFSWSRLEGMLSLSATCGNGGGSSA